MTIKLNHPTSSIIKKSIHELKRAYNSMQNIEFVYILV